MDSTHSIDKQLFINCVILWAKHCLKKTPKTNHHLPSTCCCLAFLPVVTSGYWSHDLCDANCSFPKYIYFNTTKQPFWIFSKIGVIFCNLNLLSFMVNKNPARVLWSNNLAYGGTFTSLIIKILPWMCEFADFFMAASAPVMHGWVLCARCCLSVTLLLSWSPCVSRVNLALPLTALQWHSFAPLRALPTPPPSYPVHPRCLRGLPARHSSHSHCNEPATVGLKTGRESSGIWAMKIWSGFLKR